MATLRQDAMIVAGLGLGVILIAWYLKSKVSDAIDAAPAAIAEAWDAAVDATKYVNPVRSENVVNQGTNSFYRWATGSYGTMGTDFYDATHGGMLSDGTFNPISTNNVIYRNIGDDENTIGTKIYDWLH